MLFEINIVTLASILFRKAEEIKHITPYEYTNVNL